MELTDTNIETAVVGLFIQAARAKEPILVEENGEVSFSAELIQQFLERFQVVLRVEGQVPDGQERPQPEGIRRAVLRVDRREKVLGFEASAEDPNADLIGGKEPTEPAETDPNAALISPDECPRCGSEDWDLAVEKCRKCGHQGDD